MLKLNGAKQKCRPQQTSNIDRNTLAEFIIHIDIIVYDTNDKTYKTNIHGK